MFLWKNEGSHTPPHYGTFFFSLTLLNNILPSGVKALGSLPKAQGCMEMVFTLFYSLCSLAVALQFNSCKMRKMMTL